MSRKLWKNEEEAVLAIERSYLGMNIILSEFEGEIQKDNVADAIGIALYRHVRKICEAMLYLFCREETKKDKNFKSLQLKDLCKINDCSVFDEQVKRDAKIICDLQKPFEIRPIHPEMISDLFGAAYRFIEPTWARMRGSKVFKQWYINSFPSTRNFH